MTDLWMMLALLLLPLAAVVAWPLLRKSRNQVGQSQISQAELYREHLAEIEASRASGAIDEAQYQSLKAELGRKLLAEEQGGSYRLAQSHGGGRGLLFALAFLVPFTAVGLYVYWGSHDDLSLHRDMVASQSGETDMAAEARITQQLRERAVSHPQDLNSRYVLAQRLLVSNDIAGAVEQYRYIVTQEPEAANIRAELAQALFFANGSQMSADVVREVDQVLSAQPSNTTALGLAGIAAFEQKNYAGAKSYWQRALNQMAPGSGAAQALAAGVQRAEAALAEAGGSAESSLAAAEDASPLVKQPSPVSEELGENSIAVTVSVAGSVKYSPDTPVYIYARTEESPMPLAIVRLTAADLPARVVLDEAQAMMPGRSLKTVDQVQLVARLAIGGNARPAPGDWQGEVKTLARADWSKPVTILIDQQI